MGRVRTKTVKKAARLIVEKYYGKWEIIYRGKENHRHDRQIEQEKINKKIAEEVAFIPTKRMRNKIAGFVTHLMKKIQKGPVRGISLKLQEEERERRMDFMPERSEVDVDVINIDQDTYDMLKHADIDLPNLQVSAPNPRPSNFQQRGGRV